jgi:hypothetical protein
MYVGSLRSDCRPDALVSRLLKQNTVANRSRQPQTEGVLWLGEGEGEGEGEVIVVVLDW